MKCVLGFLEYIFY